MPLPGQHYRDLVLKALFFLGPCGMFFTPFPGVGSLRTFYILVALVNLMSIARLRSTHLAQHGLLALIAGVAACSALYAYGDYTAAQGIAMNPIVRFLVLLNLLWGFYNISDWLANRDGEGLLYLIEQSYRGFITISLIGGVLYAMYVSGAGMAALYPHFVSLEQEAYGYIRFSPGTYPNEFGIISSFFTILSILLYDRYRQSRYLVWLMLSLVGLFLASTRAAYITAFLGLLTVLMLHPDRRTRLLIIALPVVVLPPLAALLSYLSFDVIAVVVGGYEALLSGRGSSAQRAQDWSQAIREFLDQYLFGSGFESLSASQLHNVPLQLLHGLGILPLFAIAVPALIFFVVQKRGAVSVVYFRTENAARTARLIRLVLAEHVLIFALTNHNQAHFFTWLLFLLACLTFRSRYEAVPHGDDRSGAGPAVVDAPLET